MKQSLTRSNTDPCHDIHGCIVIYTINNLRLAILIHGITFMDVTKDVRRTICVGPNCFP